MTVVRSIDLSDDHTFADGFPHDYFTWLREHQPVSWHEPTDAAPDGEGFWVVSRYADAHAVLRDPTTFSSECGGIRKGGGTAIKDEAVAGTMLNQSDDPQHHRLRSLVSRGFTPRAVANLESDLRTVADALLSATDPLSFDFVSGFARELPSQAICSVLGVPMQDRPNLLNWLDSGLEEKSQSIIAERAIEQIFGYARHLIDAKRSKPDEAMFSQIVHASDPAGEKLTEAELLAFFALLFPAGAETTRSALAGAVKAFAEFPDQYDRLRSDSGLLAPAIEEIVRWTTPSIYKRRTAATDGGNPDRRLRSRSQLRTRPGSIQTKVSPGLAAAPQAAHRVTGDADRPVLRGRIQLPRRSGRRHSGGSRVRRRPRSSRSVTCIPKRERADRDRVVHHADQRPGD